MWEHGLADLVVLNPTMKNYAGFFIPCKNYGKLYVISTDAKRFNR